MDTASLCLQLFGFFNHLTMKKFSEEQENHQSKDE
jgi:hypothetical protein